MTAITISNDQANSLLDLVNDQIRAQRVYLRTTPLNRTHITALTHYRNLKHLLLRQEAEARRQEEATEQTEAENVELFEIFTR